MADLPQENSSEPAREPINCPHCGGGIDASRAAAPQVVNCPHCGQPLIIPALDGSTLPTASVGLQGGQAFVIDDSPETQPQRDDELDGLRIRQISAARRAAYRSRSYCLIGGLACAVGVGQLSWMVNDTVRQHGWAIIPILYILGAVLCAIGSVWLFGRASRFKHEAEDSALEDPTNPPDFTPLRDGSQRWKGLEEIR